MKRIHKLLYFVVIILGIIFISIPIFHQNLWFDESYSVAMAKNTFIDIWTIGSRDVHPILYYWCLHVVYLLFGSNIYCYRIFSMIAIALLGIIGYTHIRKDFGEKEGILFSFLIFFLPVNSVYSGEIRMYTWAMLFVSLMCIYAYRIFQKPSRKNWILFTIFSLSSAYTHYYGLATAGIVNLILFSYLLVKLKKCQKEGKNSQQKGLKSFIVSALIQIFLYLPWLYALYTQIQGVSTRFWIEKPSLNLWLEMFIFQFTGNLDIEFISKTIAIIFGILISIYTIYTMVRVIWKEKQKNGKLEQETKYAGLGSITIYLLVIFCIFLISLRLYILYPRYLLNLTGLFVFFIAFFMAKGGRKIITILVCIITLITAMVVNSHVTKMNYAQTNEKPLDYIKEDLQSSDMILFGNEVSGFVIATQLLDVQKCFYDEADWNSKLTYEAFGKEMWVMNQLEELQNYEGRIWIINLVDFDIYHKITQYYSEKIKQIKQEKFETAYHNYSYTITLIEKSV